MFNSGCVADDKQLSAAAKNKGEPEHLLNRDIAKYNSGIRLRANRRAANATKPLFKAIAPSYKHNQ